VIRLTQIGGLFFNNSKNAQMQKIFIASVLILLTFNLNQLSIIMQGSQVSQSKFFGGIFLLVVACTYSEHIQNPKIIQVLRIISIVLIMLLFFFHIKNIKI
jgi:hypothetical protein